MSVFSTLLDGVFRLLASRHGLPGVVAGISVRGEHMLSVHQAPEVVDLAQDSVCEIGSVTKGFTGILLAELHERGTVDADAPVAHCLPNCLTAGYWQRITLRQLATHTAGLPRDPPLLGGNLLNPYSEFGQDALQEAVARLDIRPPVPPSRAVAYSNLGIALLSHCLTTAAEGEVSDLLLGLVCRPLGLFDTSVHPSTELRARIPVGHTAAGDPTPRWETAAMAGSGGLVSSVSDLLRLGDALSNPEPTALRGALRAAVTPYALGPSGMRVGLCWFLEPVRSHNLVWLTGVTGGYSSFLGVVPELGITVGALANSARHREIAAGGRTIITRVAAAVPRQS